MKESHSAQHQRLPRQIPIVGDVITINDGETFVISDHTLQLTDSRKHGIIHRDTRFVSQYRLSLNGSALTPLSTLALNANTAVAHLTNPPLTISIGQDLTKRDLDRNTPAEVFPGRELQRDRLLAKNKLHFALTRCVSCGHVRDELQVTNYDDAAIVCDLRVELESDFSDLFAIRGHVRAPAGTCETQWHALNRVLIKRYTWRTYAAQLRYVVAICDTQPVFGGGDLIFPIQLEPRQVWHSTMLFDFAAEGRAMPDLELGIGPNHVQSGLTDPDGLWPELAARCITSNIDIQRTIEAASNDIATLRLGDPDFPPGIWVPAAGMPYFMTIFGRDSEIVSLQSMMLYPGLARGTLHKLAQYQGKEEDNWRLEEPGKILHEIRFGPLAANRQIPHTPYYGSTDSTPLYVILLSEAWRWTGDAELLDRYLPAAEACLRWVDSFGDHDGDGFLDYWRWVERGLKNQGWKDSRNGVVYPDGRVVPNPIALCEFQGYVYDAKQRMAELYEALGREDQANQLRRQALELQRRFHESFWIEEEEFIALGLDPDKKPIRSVTSNAGHCLWSGILDADRAGSVVARLMADDMFCGWGIRTLSSRNRAFNPMEYHVGSVWPHDNAIIATGMKRYGFADAANRVAKAILDAAGFFQDYRLPELFGGFDRGAHSIPVLYPDANIPQAWAAGSVFMLLQMMLGLRADAFHRRLYVNPTLPEWLSDLTLIGLWVGRQRLDLHFTSRSFEVLKGGNEIEVVQLS
jgi:glycogen debranching enzyme